MSIVFSIVGQSLVKISVGLIYEVLMGKYLNMHPSM